MLDRLNARTLEGRVRELRRRGRPAQFRGDDFDWRAYSREYRGELESIERTHATRLQPGAYAFVGDVLSHLEGLPLHPNHRLLYETLLLLRPESVFEVGCGGGDHLANLHLLEPSIDLHGGDRAEEQLALLRERAPDLPADIRVLDITLPHSNRLPTVDVAFTQAVLMHIQTGNGHLVGLANLFRLARRQVVLMENWTRHPFLADARRLHAEGMLPWPELHAYFRRSPELDGRPHLLVLSAAELELEPLGDEDLLALSM